MANSPTDHGNDSYGHSLAWDPPAGSFRPLQTLPLAPADPAETNNGAEIEIRPDGKFVYVSVRGEDAIRRARRRSPKRNSGPIDQTSTEGKGPRAFEIDPTGTYLFAANQVTGNIVQFRIDSRTGRRLRPDANCT